MTKRLPSIFVSHGLPPMALFDDPYNGALINFGRSVQKEIKGIVSVSSEWIQPGPIQITASSNPSIQHGFYGYQEELYSMTYDSPSTENLGTRVQELLDAGNFETRLNDDYPLDHGVWMPMRLVRPDADLPVVQISLPMYEDPRVILKIGHSLSRLREEGILLMGSGNATLNMTKIVWHARGEDINPKIQEFDSWLKENLLTANVENILNYRDLAPHAAFAHPSMASLLPLFFTMGTSMSGDFPQIIYQAFKYSTISLLTFCLTDQGIKEELLS